MRTAIYRPLIDAAAGLVSLPPWHYQGQTFAPGVWLEGQIMQESGGDPRAIRYEKHLDLKSFGDGDNLGEDDGLLEDDASYGLMQILGANARALVGVASATPMNFGWLFLPMTNIACGLRWLLMELRAAEGDPARALARFNAGPRGEWANRQTGQLTAQGYVDKVARQAMAVEAHRRGR
jgi:transglycosylase-like protein with SLT domain